MIVLVVVSRAGARHGVVLYAILTSRCSKSMCDIVNTDRSRLFARWATSSLDSVDREFH
jgi:hypothetical protein